MAASAVRFAFLLPADAKASLAAGVVDAWSSWGVFVAQAQLVDGCRVVVDGSHGLLTGLGLSECARRARSVRKRASLRDLVAARAPC